MTENSIETTEAAPKRASVKTPDADPNAVMPPLSECTLLLDIDGTLLDLAPSPHEVRVPPGLAKALPVLLARMSGALALVSGRSLGDIDRIFAPMLFPAVGGHGAEMRISVENEAVATRAPPLSDDLKRRFAAISDMNSGILVEDKGYSLALHYRRVPAAEKEIYDAVSAIRADLPNAPIEVLPGKLVCEIKRSGFTKATGVMELMRHEPFKGRRPVFLGDDITDETVFAIMPDLRGLAFSVGRHARGVAGHFESPRAVRAWLSGLLEVKRSVSR